MGVFRLQSCMKNLGAEKKISLEDAATDWRSKGCRPVIVVDSLNFTRRLYGTAGGGVITDTICNGEYKKIAENIKTFIKFFKDISIDLVFFFDGPPDEKKLDSWIERHTRKLNEYSDILRGIETVTVYTLKKELNVFPCMILSVLKETLREENCTVKRGVDDHDKEMARYVIDNDCLGILSDDTDFLVFEKIPNVFSASQLNMENMTTTVYDRQTFLREIELHSEAMPIFATLMGNDIISHEVAKAYSRKICGTVRLNKRLLKIYAKKANLIYSQYKSRSKEELARILAYDIFRSDEWWKTTYDSLRSYDLGVEVFHASSVNQDSHWERILTRCLEKFKEGSLENQTLSIVKRQLCTQSGKLEDLENSHVDLLKGIRQRLYSILLQEKITDGGKVGVTEIIAGGANSMRPNLVETLKIDVEHPGVLELWNSGGELDDQRWKLIWWAIRSSANHPDDIVIPFTALSLFRDLSHHLMIVGLSLFYLDKVVNQLSERERTVLMVLASSVPEMNVTSLNIKHSRRFTLRAVTLSTLFMQAYTCIRWVMDVCGLQVSAKSRDAFSGQLFHYLFHLEDPTQFFEESGDEARQNYDRLRCVLDLALSETNQGIPTQAPGISESPRGDNLKEEEADNRDQERSKGAVGETEGCIIGEEGKTVENVEETGREQESGMIGEERKTLENVEETRREQRSNRRDGGRYDRGRKEDVRERRRDQYSQHQHQTRENTLWDQRRIQDNSGWNRSLRGRSSNQQQRGFKDGRHRQFWANPSDGPGPNRPRHYRRSRNRRGSARRRF